MREIDKIEHALKWKFVTQKVCTHEESIARVLKKHHAPVVNDAYRAYMQQQEKIADYLFGGLEQAIVKMKG